MLKLTQKPHAMQKSYKEWRTAFERASAAPHNGDTYNIHGGLAAGKSKHRPFRDEKKTRKCVCVLCLDADGRFFVHVFAANHRFKSR